MNRVSQSERRVSEHKGERAERVCVDEQQLDGLLDVWGTAYRYRMRRFERE